MFSYWEEKEFSNYDTVIIGAGLAGLFTSLFLKKKYPSWRILVLDKNMFPMASTKNAGFACMGSITELEDDLKTSTLSEVISLVEERYKGLEILRQELGDQSISYQSNGSFELIEKENTQVVSKISEWNKELYFIANQEAFSVASLSDRSFRGFSAMVKNEWEGEIDTGKMYQTLLSKNREQQVEIRMNTAVVDFEKKSDSYEIRLENDFILKSPQLILCTNAFTEKLLPKVKIQPARGIVLITKPIDQLTFRGIYHFDTGYYYFREIHGRVLFGGGRHKDVETETTSKLGINDSILSDLTKKLDEKILPEIPYEIDCAWSGIMGKSKTKKPICEQLDEGLILLAGFGGMGVALAPYKAKALVNLL